MKIFNEILTKIDTLRDELKRTNEEIRTMRLNNASNIAIIEKQNLILGDILKGYKTNDTFECVVFVPYRGKPVVIKNGEVVSTDDMTSFDVDWAFDRRTDVTVRRE